MPGSPNPLRDMTDSFQSGAPLHCTPGPSFQKTALPGFKLALQARRSVREYNNESIPEGVMRDCLSDAILAPNSSNLQTYELYWVRNAERKSALADACLSQPAATLAAELVVIVARSDLWKTNLDKLVKLMTKDNTQPLVGPLEEYYTKIVPMIMRTDPIGMHNFFRRCLFAFKSIKEPFIRSPINRCDHRIYGHIQSALAAQTLMLSLAAHGYDSCPIGGMDKVRIAKLLKLPSKAEVTMVISAGRGKPEGVYGPRVRLPNDDLIKEA